AACRSSATGWAGSPPPRPRTSEHREARHAAETSRPSRPGSVAEEHHAAAEPAHVPELELDADALGEPSRGAAHPDRRDEPKELVDETCLDRPGGEPRTAHGEVSVRRCLHLPDRLRVEVQIGRA